jgi:hypothetical protein
MVWGWLGGWLGGREGQRIRKRRKEEGGKCPKGGRREKNQIASEGGRKGGRKGGREGERKESDGKGSNQRRIKTK